MRKKRTRYFAIGLVLQLAIVSLIIYWITLVTGSGIEAAIDVFSSRLPSFLRDTTVVMIITAAATATSMIFYAAARSYSLSRSFRNAVLGLILVNAIILLWIILSLM